MYICTYIYTSINIYLNWVRNLEMLCSYYNVCTQCACLAESNRKRLKRLRFWLYFFFFLSVSVHQSSSSFTPLLWAHCRVELINRLTGYRISLTSQMGHVTLYNQLTVVATAWIRCCLSLDTARGRAQNCGEGTKEGMLRSEHEESTEGRGEREGERRRADRRPVLGPTGRCRTRRSLFIHHCTIFRACSRRT